MWRANQGASLVDDIHQDVCRNTSGKAFSETWQVSQRCWYVGVTALIHALIHSGFIADDIARETFVNVPILHTAVFKWYDESIIFFWLTLLLLLLLAAGSQMRHLSGNRVPDSEEGHFSMHLSYSLLHEAWCDVNHRDPIRSSQIMNGGQWFITWTARGFFPCPPLVRCARFIIGQNFTRFWRGCLPGFQENWQVERLNLVGLKTGLIFSFDIRVPRSK